MEKEQNSPTEGKSKLKLKYIKAFLPLLISHHPFCSKYNSHTLKLGKYRFCVGCFVGYPTAIIAVIFLEYFNLSSLISNDILLVLSVIFLSFLILSPLNLTENKKVKISQKIILALGGAFLLSWILNLPNSSSLNFQIGFYVIGTILLMLNINHLYGIAKICYKCDTPYDWGYCSGFRFINHLLIKNGAQEFLDGFRNFSYRIWHKKNKKNNNNRLV